MVALGSTDTKALLSQLSPALLVRLGRDVLTARRHVGIRTTDGPGDGGRDIHSLMPTGEKHLSQAKHHGDLTQACSSAELGELPMACIKFGYEHGLFLTNARISPQAKREYLDSYPGLKLEFLDGEELASAVLAHPVLRALWFDGIHIVAVASRVAFPIIARLHDGDRPLLPTRHQSLREPFLRLRAELQQKFAHLAFDLREGTSSTQPFEPYRYPAHVTQEEGFLPYLVVTEVSIAGNFALEDLQTLAETLACGFAETISRVLGRVTVVAGRPFLTAIEGGEAGIRTSTQIDRTAVVGCAGSAFAEPKWFMPCSPEDGWTDVCDARQTEIPEVRLFHSELDVALESEILASPSQYEKAMREVTANAWHESVFALVPAFEVWPHEGVAPPDERARWLVEDKEICGWLHGSLLGGLISIPRDHGDEQKEPVPFPFSVRETRSLDESRRLEAIRSALSAIPNVALVASDRARHMVAVLGLDPLKEVSPRRVGIGPQLVEFETYPSPVCPDVRQLRVTLAWQAAEGHRDVLEALRLSLADTIGATARLTFDDEYSVLEVGPIEVDVTKPATAAVKDLTAAIRVAIEHAEATATAAGDPLRRATRRFWEARHGVRLGTPWHESTKPYMWVEYEPGKYRAVRVRPEDLELGSLPPTQGPPSGT